jgi:hypothetical protein
MIAILILAGVVICSLRLCYLIVTWDERERDRDRR